MKAKLTITYNHFFGEWDVEVEDYAGNSLFYDRTLFKYQAWISYFNWKYIARRFKPGKNVDKQIKL